MVPDSRYNAKVPVLLGTNILEQFLDMSREKLGHRFLQASKLHTPWHLSFRCMVLREKELARKKNRLGVVKSAENRNIIVQPNSILIDRVIDYKPTCAMLQSIEGSDVTTLLDIAPTLVNFQSKRTGFVDVHLSNVTTQTVVIPPHAVLCELQPVTLASGEEREEAAAELKSYMDKIHISSKVLTDHEVQRFEALLKCCPDIFSCSDTDVGHSTRVRHQINVTNEIPFKERHRYIPPGMYSQVREHLQQVLDSGVIRPSHSPWSSNVVLVKKKDGSLRLCIDFRQLNSRTVKDSYALPRIEELLDALAGSKYFSVLDMKSGYHQIELAEDHKERTAFTVAPLGFFKYNRMAMGLENAPATYQRLVEECLGDLHLTVCLVFLDDIIIFSDTFEDHLDRIERVLLRLRECGLKLNPKKCSFCQEKVKLFGTSSLQMGW